jgi:hypothetical protein
MRLDTLQARLAKSLDSANTRKENATPRPKPATRSATRHAPRPQKGGGYLRLCISLTPADQERIDAICSYLAAKGERVTTSRAVKLALRTAPLSADLAAALASVKAEDGRARGK